ncbi:MAG: putative 2OG-Fe(II) oxygenase [Pseudomonadota bacterium]
MGKRNRKSGKGGAKPGAGRRMRYGQHLLGLPKSALPDTPQACWQLARQLNARQQPFRALSAVRHGLALAPGSPDLALEYAVSLGYTEQIDAARIEFPKALGSCDGTPDAEADMLTRFAEMLVNCGFASEAETHLRKALALKPKHAAAHTQMCWAMRRAGNRAAAIEHGEQAFALSPDEDAGAYLTYAYLGADRFADAVAVTDQMLSRNPLSVRALALRVSALEGAGRRDEGVSLAHFESLVWSAGINPPAGYASVAKLNRDLAELVTNYPMRPYDTTQTLNLFDQPEPPAAALAGVLQMAASHYLQNLPADPQHPYLGQRPDSFKAESWGTLLYTYGDAEHHFHQNAWVSGVYYVDMPDFVQRAPPDNLDGCLEFSRFLNYSGSARVADNMVIRPEPGLIVMFPAYAYHRVLPFKRRGRRISIAFNLLPE